MNVLLDACVPRPLRNLLSGETIRTAQEMGWSDLKNGDLLAAAEAQFDVMITSDQNIKYQQNLSGRKIAILVLPTNDWPIIRQNAVEIATAVQALCPGAFVEINWR